MTHSPSRAIEAPLAVLHGVPRNFNDGITDTQQLQYALTTLAAAMHTADLTLTRITTSEDDNAALNAIRARSLLSICMIKFSKMMEVQS